MSENKKFRSGFVTIVGRPNVGKSTLMNALVGEKVAIVSNRPQTTRNRIMGVMTRENWQMVFLDTPGIHTPRTKLGNYMMQSVREAMDGMDGMMVLVDATQVGEHDRSIVKEMASKKVPKVLLLNKIDLLQPEKLLALIASFADCGYDAIIPISAKTGDGLEQLTKTMAEKLHLSVREYGNLERGRHGLSAFTMLLFLETMADEAILCLLHECKDIIGENDESLGE